MVNPALVFQSKSPRQLLAQQSKGWNHVVSERWIRYYQAKSDTGDLSGLSVKRRMSVWIAERTDGIPGDGSSCAVGIDESCLRFDGRREAVHSLGHAGRDVSHVKSS